ncbi:hypothetical protein [Desulfovibrio sp. 86]|uniref:Lipoprotein n=1 Tax=uncultured Desulfovibrio sp. TaxID=167968 RepID=A0A212KXN4_9BACT|nr:hypothetical protein [Desulfovibrio sp. 86]SCM69899.1 conserved exported hypothetical protein [uncultured Desulfovibrio sp.]VZH35234.1 conserved exported protein of unknown function [Desulfovibrio sp. 86]
MKALLLTLMLVLTSVPCFAASCSDTQNAATEAIKERNARVKDTHNTTMPDPEEDRGPLSNCLGSIASIGDAFSLGVSIPSMDSIINGMCRQVDSLIQSKMNEVLSEARSSVGAIGRNNPFQVSGSSDVSGLLRKIK